MTKRDFLLAIVWPPIKLLFMTLFWGVVFFFIVQSLIPKEERNPELMGEIMLLVMGVSLVLNVLGMLKGSDKKDAKSRRLE